jgi:hypothetical protein
MQELHKVWGKELYFVTIIKYDSFSCHSLIFLCFQIRKWKSFNATYAKEQALQYPGVAIEVCNSLLLNSQAGKLNKKMCMLTPATDSTLGRELVLTIRKSAIFKDSKNI